MLYAFGFERVGVVVGDLFFVDPDPGPGQEGAERGVRLEVRVLERPELRGLGLLGAAASSSIGRSGVPTCSRRSRARPGAMTARTTTRGSAAGSRAAVSGTTSSPPTRSSGWVGQLSDLDALVESGGDRRVGDRSRRRASTARDGARDPRRRSATARQGARGRARDSRPRTTVRPTSQRSRAPAGCDRSVRPVSRRSAPLGRDAVRHRAHRTRVHEEPVRAGALRRGAQGRGRHPRVGDRGGPGRDALRRVGGIDRRGRPWLRHPEGRGRRRRRQRQGRAPAHAARRLRRVALPGRLRRRRLLAVGDRGEGGVRGDRHRGGAAFRSSRCSTVCASASPSSRCTRCCSTAACWAASCAAIRSRRSAVGFFARDNLPWPVAGLQRWGELAFAAIDGEQLPASFEPPRTPPWRG